MILTVFRISALRLIHNKSEMLLTFLVPIAFFSIFALIFGNRGNGGAQRVRIAICDEVQSKHSIAARDQIEKQAAIRLFPESSADRLKAVDRNQLVEWVRRGVVQAGLLIQAEPQLPVETKFPAVPLGEPFVGTPSIASTNQPLSPGMQVKLLTDSYDQVTSQVVTALVQRAILTTSHSTSPPVPSMNLGVDGLVTSASHWDSGMSIGSPKMAPAEVEVIDILGIGKSNPSVAMYAAGIAFMFLLFSSVSTAGTILEEREKGTFERLMTSQLSIDELLMGK